MWCEQNHPWIKEETISVESFRADLLRRKAQVEEEKRKEREQQRRSTSKQMLDGEFDPFAMDVSRSVASSIVSEPGSEVFAPLYPKASVAVYTSFQSSRPPAEVQARVETLLTETSARFVARKDRFKTKVSMPAEDVSFTVRIYSLANVSSPSANAC